MDRPERPLFVGRKPFLPSGRLHTGFVGAATVRAALEAACADHPGSGRRAQWPAEEGTNEDGQIVEMTDGRNWSVDVHAGLRQVAEGRLGNGQT